MYTQTNKENQQNILRTWCRKWKSVRCNEIDKQIPLRHKVKIRIPLKRPQYSPGNNHTYESIEDNLEILRNTRKVRNMNNINFKFTDTARII